MWTEENSKIKEGMQIFRHVFSPCLNDILNAIILSREFPGIKTKIKIADLKLKTESVFNPDDDYNTEIKHEILFSYSAESNDVLKKFSLSIVSNDTRFLDRLRAKCRYLPTDTSSIIELRFHKASTDKKITLWDFFYTFFKLVIEYRNHYDKTETLQLDYKPVLERLIQIHHVMDDAFHVQIVSGEPGICIQCKLLDFEFSYDVLGLELRVHEPNIKPIKLELWSEYIQQYFRPLVPTNSEDLEKPKLVSGFGFG